MQVLEGLSRDLRGTEDHAGAGNRIEHPCWDGDHRSGGGLDMDHLTGPATFAVERANGMTKQRMPTIVDGDSLPDMGRMTR